MKKITNNLIIIFFSLFFAFIFYKKIVGLNLFLYDIALIAFLVFGYKVFDFKNKLHLAVLSGTLLTAVGVLFHASSLVITMNILSLVLLFGIVNNRELKLLINSALAALVQFFLAVFKFLRGLQSHKRENRRKRFWKWLGIILIPLVALVVFFQLYSASSSEFDAIFGFIGIAIEEFFHKIFIFIFDHVNWSFFFLLVFGFIISCAYFVKIQPVTPFKEPKTETLLRKRKHRYHGSKTGLLTEFRIAVTLFLLLNILLLIFNIIDIKSVWFHFEWNGEFLKEFVHQGTYVLIFTLLLSIGLVWIFFRKNLNFLSKNKPLKILANIWLVQNMVMTVSVLIRNSHYINYYNLAYLRIGVLLFVALVFVGLTTTMIKINTSKNFFYLLRVNILATYVALILFSLADWDVIIAKFNFSRADKSFIALNFLSQLSEKALPYLDKTTIELERIEQNPVHQKIGYRSYFMETEVYFMTISERKERFLQSYPDRTFLEWNYADYKAYKMLNEGMRK